MRSVARNIILVLVGLFFASHAKAVPICSNGTHPVTINSNWQRRACGAQSGLNPTSCGTLCQYFDQAPFQDLAIAVNDTVVMFCDVDGSQTGATFVVVDNALGANTISAANSGGNSNITATAGTAFASGWVGGYMLINGFARPIITFTDSTHLVVSGNTGTLTGVLVVAGNLFTKLGTPDFSFANEGQSTTVLGNAFYLLGSAYAKASGYLVRCSYITTGQTTHWTDTSVAWYRQTGGGASAGVDATSVWTSARASGSSTTCGGNTCFSQGSTPSITVVANDLAIAMQQQNDGTMPGTFTAGSPIGCDNDGTTDASSTFGGFYFSICSNTAASGSVSYHSYEPSASSLYANIIFALLPTAPSVTPAKHRNHGVF